MKTRTIILLAQKIDSLVATMNDFVPSYAHEEMVDYYNRASNIFGELIYECVYYWLVNKELRYDYNELVTTLSPFQMEMFTSLEKRYLRIILFAGDSDVYRNEMTREIALKRDINLN